MGLNAMLSPVPRWTIQGDETKCAFYSPDGKTLVTITFSLAEGMFYGPLQVWDIDSGQLRASYLDNVKIAGVIATNSSDMRSFASSCHGKMTVMCHCSTCDCVGLIS